MAKTISFKELLTQDDIEEAVKDLPFEDGLKLLDELVQRVEAGSLPLDTAVKSYEKGVILVERLRALLTGAEQRLQILQKGKK